MPKIKDKKTGKFVKPADSGLPGPGKLPSEAETGATPSGSLIKKGPEEEITGLMGVKHVKGPPGSWHG